LEDEIINLGQKGFFALVLNTSKRFETDEIKRTKIELRTGDSITVKTETDSNGYYLINKPFEHLSSFANTEGGNGQRLPLRLNI